MSKGNNAPLIESITIRELKTRGLTEATCQKWGYGVATLAGDAVQVATYRNAKGETVAQKVRTRDKDFRVRGDGKNLPLFGMHLWKTGGKKVVVTEGEIDAMSLSQLQDHKWPVVSVPTGAGGAEESIKRNIEWLSTFDQVVLCFDSDKPGQSAVNACAKHIQPGKCYVAELPLKDANEMLKAGRGRELLDCIWQARVFRPDGIIDGAEVTVESLKEVATVGLPTPYAKLNEISHGLRKGELVMLTAGTGIGKSTLARELAYALRMDHNQRIGNLFLEESYRKTAQGYAAIHNNVPLGALRSDPSLIPDDLYRETIDKVIRGGMYFYDHFGSLDSDNLMAKLEYLVVGLGCDWVVIDHISIVVSGMESSSGEGERRDIDILMTKLRSLVERTGVGLICIVHLKQPEGKAHEEGAEVSLNQLRGSGALKQIPDLIIAMERNQQDEDEKDIAQFRVLKNREWGDTGIAGCCRYDRATGRLVPTGDKFPSAKSAGFKDETQPPGPRDY